MERHYNPISENIFKSTGRNIKNITKHKNKNKIVYL